MNTSNYPPEVFPYLGIDYHETPITVAWEITRACQLSCIYCRAEVERKPHPIELSVEDGFRVIDDIVDIGTHILVITGGDPLMRPDVHHVIDYAVSKGLQVELAVSATKLATRQSLQRIKNSGVSIVHVGLDGPSPEEHDTFKGSLGSYQRTMEILEDLEGLPIPIQISTTISRYNLHVLPNLVRTLTRRNVAVWNLFFLVPFRRAWASDMITPSEHESVYQWLYYLSKHAPFHIRATAAPGYNRVAIQMRRPRAGTKNASWEFTGTDYSLRSSQPPPEVIVNDGKGICLIDHLGNVCPGEFLQLPAGNVRNRPLAEIYKESPLFRDLRDPSKLRGKCGACEFKSVCGGSRARAYAVTGDYLAPDPSCPYVPIALRRNA